MRFLSLAASLVLLTTPTAWSADIPALVPDMSYSSLFGPNAVHEYVNGYGPTNAPTVAPTSAPTPTSAPEWTAFYEFTTMNFITSKLPYPPHTKSSAVIINGKPRLQPVPVQERFTSLEIFGNATALLATVPLSNLLKRTPFSAKYNNTAFTSVSQFPKFGAGKLTSIDIFDDEFFGLMRFNGPNPTVIRKISTISSKFGDLATLRSKYSKIDSLLADGKIYELDYAKLVSGLPSPALLNTPLAAPPDSILAYPQNGNPGQQQRYLTAPYVLLQVVEEKVKDKKVSKLVPIAIQLGQTYVAGQTAILYRADYKDRNGVAKAGVDQGDWNYAKIIVNAADATLHQLEAHLVNTHLVMENVIIGTHVKLGQYHPISRLIVGDKYSEGHSYKTLQINEDARNSLIPGIVDEVFSGGYAGAALLVNSMFASYNWVADYVINDLPARGFPTPCKADLYLYAKDAKDSWDHLRKFVNSVLKSYYSNDKAVEKDEEVKAWATLLSTATLNDYPTNSTRRSIPVPGFPSNFTKLDALVDAVTHAIYKSTVGHSVVNYPQTFYNAYIPIYPALALYKPILDATTVGTGLTTDAYIAAALGNANTQQIMTATALGLGQPVAASGLPDDLTLLQYAQRAAAAPATDAVGLALKQAASTLLTDLIDLSRKIQKRDADFVGNKQPHYQYGYFDPTRVANAIYA